MRPLALASLALLALASRALAQGSMCGWDPAKINLGGDTVEETVTADAKECCDRCASKPDYGCMGYNFCSEDGCDGDFKRGACHLKRFSGNAPAWGCSGDAQKWRSGLMSPSLRYEATPPPCAAPGAPASVAAGVPTSARANWAGTLVVLDVDTWKMGEGGNHGSPYVRTPYACAYNCHDRVGRAGANGVTANAFTYCDDPEGCGSGCAQFSRGNAPKDGSKDELYFGPFLDSRKSGCTDSGDKFKYQTCSCKAVGGEPVPLADDSTQWISGYTVARGS